jgi:hypothetical protein
MNGFRAAVGIPSPGEIGWDGIKTVFIIVFYVTDPPKTS